MSQNMLYQQLFLSQANLLRLEPTFPNGKRKNIICAGRSGSGTEGPEDSRTTRGAHPGPSRSDARLAFRSGHRPACGLWVFSDRVHATCNLTNEIPLAREQLLRMVLGESVRIAAIEMQREHAARKNSHA